jgi:hypothetical protein
MAIQKMLKTHFESMVKFRNYTLEETKDCIVKDDPNGSIKNKDGDDIPAHVIYADNEHKNFPHSVGAGSELKKILQYVGIKATPNCACNRRALEMDSRGVEWCRNNKEHILKWLEEEAKRRKLPFVKFGAEQMLKLAIRRASKDPRSRK